LDDFCCKKIQKGLQEIYKLVELSFDQFYYRQRITNDQVNNTSNNIYILSGVAPRWDLIKVEVWKELLPSTPFCLRKPDELILAGCDNFYVDREDSLIYEPFAEDRLRERKTSPLHIITHKEWISIYGNEFAHAIEYMKQIASECNVDLPIAPMVKYTGKENIEAWCKKGAREKKIDLSDPIYKARYKREMDLIIKKDYADYFLVVADLIKYAKTKMAVGPARGSSAGSLVCYLMGITEINPLDYDLYFERFIDINRFDLPDIDVDFQDDKRHLCIKYLERKYGKDNVAQIGNINRMKPKSAITRFAQALGIPIDDVIELKDAIMERSGGDARASACIEDTLSDTEIGKKFLETHPSMSVVKHIESHPSHTGVHAAGVLVCNRPITDYCGVNSRDKKRIGMLDKKDAEAINLLKIDALGLRTLSIIADVCDQIGKHYEWMYEIPTDDEKAFKVFNDHRFNGIFQFEGSAIQGLAKQMPIENMEDVAAVGALGRPGPLVSGGATSFIGYRNRPESIKYLSDHPAVVKATKKTYGIVIYQEQMMNISREYGKLSWKDTSDLRKAASKSLGDEFFDKFKGKFLKGAIEELGERKRMQRKFGKPCTPLDLGPSISAYQEILESK
jgi:DNA polymerase III alpha subunit